MSDVLTVGSQRDACVVLPNLQSALHWWPKIVTMFEEAHGPDNLRRTKTAIVMRRTVVRLWVPYEKEPTMPMDTPEHRMGFEMLNLYGMYKGGS